MFAAFASHSGDSYFRYAHPSGVSDRAAHAREICDWTSAVRRSFRERSPSERTAEYATMEMLGYAAAYSPRSATAFDLDLPFDLENGATARGRLRALAGLRSRRTCAVAERGTRAASVALPGLRPARRIWARRRRAVVAQRMRDMGLDVRHEEFDDDHRNVGYRYAVSLPALADVLERNEPRILLIAALWRACSCRLTGRLLAQIPPRRRRSPLIRICTTIRAMSSSRPRRRCCCRAASRSRRVLTEQRASTRRGCGIKAGQRQQLRHRRSRMEAFDGARRWDGPPVRKRSPRQSTALFIETDDDDASRTACRRVWWKLPSGEGFDVAKAVCGILGDGVRGIPSGNGAAR